MSREYLRVPLVQRFEYLAAFLNSYRKVEFDEEQARIAVQRQINLVEVEKAKALGRKRPRMREGTSGSLDMSIAIYRSFGARGVGSAGEYKLPNRPVHDDVDGFGHGVPLACHPTQREWGGDSKPWRLAQTR